MQILAARASELCTRDCTGPGQAVNFSDSASIRKKRCGREIIGGESKKKCYVTQVNWTGRPRGVGCRHTVAEAVPGIGKDYLIVRMGIESGRIEFACLRPRKEHHARGIRRTTPSCTRCSVFVPALSNGGRRATFRFISEAGPRWTRALVKAVPHPQEGKNNNQHQCAAQSTPFSIVHF